MIDYTWDSIFAVHEYFSKSQISLNFLNSKIKPNYDDQNQVVPPTCFGKYWDITGHPFSKKNSFDNKSLQEIEFLFLENLSLEDIFPIKALTNLEVIYSYNNAIDSLVPLKKLNKLKEIDFNKNKINNLEPISNLTSLEVIDLSENHITYIGELSDLTKLKELYLGGNKIQRLSPLSNLQQLKKLNLSFNKLEDIDQLHSLHKLQLLQLEGNNIKTEKIIELGKTLKKCEIHFNPLDLMFDYGINGGYLYFKLIDNYDVPFLIDLNNSNNVKHITVALLDKKFKSKKNIIEEMKDICRQIIANDDNKGNTIRNIKRELFLEETCYYVRGQFDY